MFCEKSSKININSLEYVRFFVYIYTYKILTRTHSKGPIAFYKYQSWNEILWLARSCGGMNLIRNYKCNAFHFVSNHRNSWKSTERAAKCSTSHFSMKSREIPCSYVLCATEMEIFFFFPPVLLNGLHFISSGGCAKKNQMADVESTSNMCLEPDDFISCNQ